MRTGMQTVHHLALSATIFTVLFLGGVLHPRSATAATYYVATNGNNANPGTQAQPFKTISRGLSVLRAGDTLYLRGGTYAETIDSNRQTIPSGTSWSNAITIASYFNETATLAPTGGVIIDLGGSSIGYLVFDRLILDCTHCSAGQAGILVQLRAHHIRFQNGEIKNGTGPLVQLYHAKDAGGKLATYQAFNEILNSKIHGATNSYGFYIQSSNNLIAGNKIYNNAGFGIQIYTGYFPTVTTDNNIVHSNHIYNNGFSRQKGAITVATGRNCLIYNNIIYGNFGGVEVSYNSTNQQVYNNTLYKNGRGIDVYPYNNKGIIIRNNILYQNGLTINDRGVGTIQSNNLTTDPKFVDASTNNFALQPTSPAINAGITLSIVSTDINKTPRPQGASYDIGAYEYRSSQFPVPTNLRQISVAP